MKKIYFKEIKTFSCSQYADKVSCYDANLIKSDPISAICICSRYGYDGSEYDGFSYYLLSVDEALKKMREPVQKGKCLWSGFILHKMIYRTLIHSIDPTINIDEDIRGAYDVLSCFFLNESVRYFHSNDFPLDKRRPYNMDDEMICWEKHSYGDYYNEVYYTIRFSELEKKLSEIKDPANHFIEGFIYNGEYFKDRFDDVFDCEELFYIFKHAKDYTLYY